MTKNLMVPKPPMMQRGGAQAPPAPQTPQEMVKSPIANPWMSRDMMMLLNSLRPEAVKPTRTIAISGCSYATVLQVRGWLPPAVGAICWFAFDNPAESARIPIFAGTKEPPPSFEVCAQHRFRMDSAAWAFRRANRFKEVRSESSGGSFWGQKRLY